MQNSAQDLTERGFEARFKKYNLGINWTTILVGWIGFQSFPRQLFTKDMIDYAVHLAVKDESQPEEVWQLAGLSEKDREEAEHLVMSLARKEACSEVDEQRKWRVILLKEQIDELPASYLYGLIALTEFWAAFGYPDDSPHVVQGRNNLISPSEYYCQDVYLKLVEANRNWADEEISKLASKERV